MLPIDKGIPFPEKADRVSRYPFREMEVGESFFVAGGNVKSLAAQCSRWGKIQGKTYGARRVDAGVRVWRLG